MKNNNANNPENKPSKPSKFSNGIQVPPSRRKSLRAHDTRSGSEVTPLPRSHVAMTFLSVFSLYSLMSSDAIGRGVGNLTHDHFMLIGCVATAGSAGLSLRGINRLLYRTVNHATFRAMRYRLRLCVDAGWLVGWRDGNAYRYRLSSYCEKLIVRSVGREALRDMAIVVRESMK